MAFLFVLVLPPLSLSGILEEDSGNRSLVLNGEKRALFANNRTDMFLPVLGLPEGLKILSCFA